MNRAVACIFAVGALSGYGDIPVECLSGKQSVEAIAPQQKGFENLSDLLPVLKLDG